MDSLDKPQRVPLSAHERATLQETAAHTPLTPGLFSRALLLHALTLFDAGDPDTLDAVTREQTEARIRITEAAETANKARWRKS